MMVSDINSQSLGHRCAKAKAPAKKTSAKRKEGQTTN